MNRTMGAVLLVAGTCIGSGMIALPLVLSSLGLVPSIFLMLGIWFVMYYTSLINLELNLQAGRGFPLGVLGRIFSGRWAEIFGAVLLKLLSYSLLAVFIYGGTSVLQKLLSSVFAVQDSFFQIATGYSLVALALLLLPIRWIDYINRLIFIVLMGIIAILLGGLLLSTNWLNLPLFSEHYKEFYVWRSVIPIVFTSFGFQVIFHTLSNYCKMDAKVLKRAFFWGSLIPAIVYVLWTCSVLSVVHDASPAFYREMAAGNKEVGALIQHLAAISKYESIQFLVWWVSFLAITTSVLGVGVGLCDSLSGMILPEAKGFGKKIIVSLMTIVPAYFVVIAVPNAFITVLGFAGMILAFIAVLLPVYLFSRLSKNYHYPELNKKWLVILSVAVAALVVISEALNLLLRAN